MFGLVTAGFLWRKFKYAIVGIVILAAIISPTQDAFNLMVWTAPMVLLYIISIERLLFSAVAGQSNRPDRLS